MLVNDIPTVMGAIPSATPPRSTTDAELDELEDDFESDVDDDPNTFKIRKPIKPATALLLSTKQLHGMCRLFEC